MSEQKKVLVTGAAGFIGSHLCNYLLTHDENVHVFGLDNFITGHETKIKHLIKSERFTFIEQDLIKPLSDKIANTKFDEIYNMACPASPIKYQNNAVETLQVNSVGIKNILDLALKHNSKFLQASTSEVYGDPQVHPQKESYWGNVNSFGPRACYDVGKRFAEAFIWEYKNKKNLNVRIARIFNTYGSRMDYNDGRVVPNLIMQALDNKPLTVYGTGNTTRSFCFVDDLVEGLVSLMASDYRDPVNLGSAKETPLLELAKLIKELANSNSELVFEPSPVDDPKKRLPDISIAKDTLHWQPKVPLREGLIKTINWFKENK